MFPKSLGIPADRSSRSPLPMPVLASQRRPAEDFRSAVHHQEFRRRPRPTSGAGPGRRSGKGRMTELKILVVEDDPDLAESFAEVLGLGGHNVSVAPNGAEAVKCFEKVKYDLSFIDVRMPVMNGVDCFFAIRALYPDAKIVLMTDSKSQLWKRR